MPSHASTSMSGQQVENHRKEKVNPILFRLTNLRHALSTETAKHWDEIQSNINREWSKVASTVLRILPTFNNISNSSNSRKLDEVLKAFQSLQLNGNQVETAKLLKACRAHLTLMKSGGPSLKLVAKDMESNLQKAESLFQELHPKNKGKDLTSLLQTERESGIHNGNVLRDSSAAMGLLWIRRSLAFQKDLYSSLVHGGSGSSKKKKQQHPRDAALDAYEKHLSPFHGWMLQKIFPLSLSQMPEREVFIAKFGGKEIGDLDKEYEEEIVHKLKSLVGLWEPLISTWEDEFEKLDLEDTRRV